MLNLSKTFAKYALIAMFWFIPTVPLYLLLFSTYPNYILAGQHNKMFEQARRVADDVINDFSGQSKVNRDEIFLNISTIALTKEYCVPPHISHPYIQVQSPENLPETAYFQKPYKPVVYHTTMVPDPYTTYAPLPGKIEGYVFHNRQQFRYPIDLEKKKKNEIRIFITGASVAWGCNATDTTFTIAGSMERELHNRYPGRDIKVITAAAGGWTSTQERIWIFNRITEYEPDMIIHYSGVNDALYGGDGKEDLFNRYYSDAKYYHYAIAGYEFYNRGAVMAGLALKDTAEKYKSTDFPRKTLKNVTIINAFLKRMNIPYIYVLQPLRKDARDSISDYYEALAREMCILARKDGFLFVDHSRFLDQKTGLFTDPTHLGDRGYQMVAADLLERIDLRLIIK